MADKCVTEHRAYIYDRGGRARLAELRDIAQVQWARDRDGIGQAVDVHRADFTSKRIPADFAAERMGDQLMSVADAQQRQASVGGLAQPHRAAFGPVQPFGDHRS